MDSKYVIEVRRRANQKQFKYFNSAPDRHGYRIRQVSTIRSARQFRTEAEAEAVREYLSGCYVLNFTVRQISVDTDEIICPVSDITGERHYFVPGKGEILEWDMMGDARHEVEVCASCAGVSDDAR